MAKKNPLKRSRPNKSKSVTPDMFKRSSGEFMSGMGGVNPEGRLRRDKQVQNPNRLGSLLFLFGAITAVVLGLISRQAPYLSPHLTSLLIFLGILVGFLNVTRKETQLFLISGVSLVVVLSFGGAFLGQVVLIGEVLERILISILSFVVPSIIIVALKTIYSIEEH